MKKLIIYTLVCIGLLTVPVFNAYSQNVYTYSSDHYVLVSGISEEFSEDTASLLEGFFKLYTGYLHFDPKNLKAPMKVRIFADKTSFDSYLANYIDGNRSSFVFLQYPDPKRSELIAYRTTPQETFQRKLVHHAFVQYIKSFIPNPPLWIQKGFAVYFENCTYDTSTKTASFRPNHAWVATLRQKLNEDSSLSNPEVFIPVRNLLFLDQTAALQNLEAFYAQSWGLIDFLIHSEKKAYNRLLWDAVAALETDADMSVNEQQVVARSFEWVAKDTLVEDFVEYILTLPTFPDLVQSGIDSYSMGRLEESEKYFQQALELRQDHYVPHYYLGLIYYNRGEYSMAEFYYLSAAKKNGSTDLIYYALGVNAYADNRIDDSTFYLSQSIDAAGSYSSLASELAEEIEGDSGSESDSM